jgi:hypothetical protein
MNEPGKIQRVGIEGTSQRIYHTCLCGACKAERVTIDSPYKYVAVADLLRVHRWTEWEDIGWVCEACQNFLASLPASKPDALSQTGT